MGKTIRMKRKLYLFLCSAIAASTVFGALPPSSVAASTNEEPVVLDEPALITETGEIQPISPEIAELAALNQQGIAVHMYTDFENYNKVGSPPSGFEMTGSAEVKATSGAVNDSATEPYGTSMALHIKEAVAASPDVGLGKRFGADDLTGELIFDFDVLLKDLNGSRFIEIKDSSSNRGMTLASIGTDGKVKVGTQSVKLETNQWTRLSFAFTMNTSAAIVSLYVDGEKKLEDVQVDNLQQAEGVNYIRVRAKRVEQSKLQADATGEKNFTTWLDNMRLYTGIEPKSMEELAELNQPDSLMNVNNDLGISVEDRLAGALAMMLNNSNLLFNNERIKNAFDVSNMPQKLDGVIVVPLRKAAEMFGIPVQISGDSATVQVNGQLSTVEQDKVIIAEAAYPSEQIRFMSNEVMVPLQLAAAMLQKEAYTDYKGRGLIVIGESEQPFNDELDKVDEQVKPQDNEKFYIEEAVKQIIYDRPGGEQAMNLLESRNTAHPRIVATASDFSRVKALIQAGDTTITKWYADIIKQGEKHLAMPVPTDDLPDGRRMIGSRQVGPLVINLGMLYHLSDDPVRKEQYKARIWSEVHTVSQFPSWNEDNEFLNTAEFMEGLAIAYDWLYDAWTEEERELLEDAIIHKGLVKSLEAYNKNVWWIHTYPRTNNWNAVSNGSTILALMAIGDVDKQIKLPSNETVSMHQFGSKILDVAFNALEDYILLEFTPDGAWAEGPSYWKYTLEYIVRFIAAMESALGTSYGYDQTPGLNKTAYFPTYLSGSVGSLNYGDASNNKVISAEELWIAKKYEDKLLASIHLDNKVKYRNAGSELEMLWYEPSFYVPNQSLEPDQYFSGTEVATFRSKWDDPAATFLGLKAGNNVVSHGHYDLGSFVFEALGQQWAIDLGKDDYNLPGYSNYDKERLTYYRLNPEGHNTLVINPDGTAQQNIKAFSKIEKTESKALGGYAITNLTEAYDKYVTEAKRGIMLASNRMRATIQDEITFIAPSTAYWFMHTEAEIEVSEDGQTAIFSKGGEKLAAVLNSDARNAAGDIIAASFGVMEAIPLPMSPNPPKQHKNEGIRKLFVKLDGVKEMRLTVTLIPIVGDEEDTNTAVNVSDLEEWSIADGELIIPVIQNASVDGKALTSFSEQNFNYDIALPLDYTNVPELSFVYDELLYDVQMVPAAEVPGVTKLIVSSLHSPEIKSVYRFNYKLIPQNGEDDTLVELPVEAVSASTSQAELGNTEDKAIDGDFATYWGAEGDQWIRFDLAEAKTINSVGIAFIRGNERSFKFDIETSLDGLNWYKAYSGQSSGESLDIEKVYLRQHTAQYVRVTGYGNSVNQWNSYAEVRLYQLPQTDPVEPGNGNGNNNNGNSGNNGNNDNSGNENENENENGNGNTEGGGEEGINNRVLHDIAGYWAETSIKRAVELGIVTGYTDNTFRPREKVTRAEFAVMLGKTLKRDKNAEAELLFEDTAAIPGWAAGYVAQIAKAGLISGYEDHTYRPNKEITRSELAAIIVRALELPLINNVEITFADADQIADWARPYVAAAVKAGVIKGKGNNQFAPNQSASRAEATVLVLALLDQSRKH